MKQRKPGPALSALLLALSLPVAQAAAQQPTAPGVEPEPIKAGAAPAPGPYAPGFDALHYDIALELPDTGTFVRGRTLIAIALKAPRADTLRLDFSGLAVDRVYVNDDTVVFAYDSRKLRVAVPAAMRVGDTLHVEVLYHGHPDDGLIIRPNVHGLRSAFADNWPDRARYWFPGIDHPSDKATVAFAVTTPASWQLIANGLRLPGNRPAGMRPDPSLAYGPRVLWRWGTDVPIPTYTMVIGAGQFATGGPKKACDTPTKCVDVEWWSFRQDSASMARSFRRAHEMVEFFTRTIGPFPYEKLSHLESATRFGGMENASAIFYDEKAIAAGTDIESTVSHETAHQWFGDAVTETDWHELWLSEGFASFFGALFFEKADGAGRFHKLMLDERTAYLKSKSVDRPVVDTAEHNLFALLNTNNYQKGAWVLHMLREMLGDDDFFRGIRSYYADHRNGNASTADLRKALERTSGRDLGWFFDQWLYQPGYPQLKMTATWNRATHEEEVLVEQVQPASWPTFRLPLSIAIEGRPSAVNEPLRNVERVELSGRHQVFHFPAASAPLGVRLDPDDQLLATVLKF